MKVEIKRVLGPKNDKTSAFVNAPMIQLVDRQPLRNHKGEIQYYQKADGSNGAPVMNETIYRLSTDPNVEGAVTEFTVPNDEAHMDFITSLMEQVKPAMRTVTRMDQASKRMVKVKIEDVQNLGRFLELSDLPPELQKKK